MTAIVGGRYEAVDAALPVCAVFAALRRVWSWGGGFFSSFWDRIWAE
jgi:hypothetical protein